MRKTFAALAVAALTLVGCSTANAPADEFTAPGGAPETNERGTITAQLGQTYEIGNCDGEACATFSVTKIETGECEDPFEEPTGRIIDVHVNWQASDKLSETYSYGLFNPGFWWIADKDGNETENDGMNLNPPCPGDEDGIGDTLEAGKSKQGKFQLQVPSNADRLLFEPMEGEGTWDWQIPPNDAAASVDTDAADRPGQAMPAGTSEGGKSILMCGIPGTHEFGTTKFVDGTTGYTSKCDQHMRSTYHPVDTDVPPATEGIPDYGSDYQPPAYEPAPDYYEPPAAAPAPEVYEPAPALPDGAGGGQAGY